MAIASWTAAMTSPTWGHFLYRKRNAFSFVFRDEIDEDFGWFGLPGVFADPGGARLDLRSSFRRRGRFHFTAIHLAANRARQNIGDDKCIAMAMP